MRNGQGRRGCLRRGHGRGLGFERGLGRACGGVQREGVEREMYSSYLGSERDCRWRLLGADGFAKGDV